MTSRRRKLEFIKSFSSKKIETIVMEMLAAEGPSFLTDDQVSVICSKLIGEARYMQHINMRERARVKALRTLAYIDSGIPHHRNLELKPTGNVMPQAAE